MSQFDVIMPKLGESITEATITKWFKKEGDVVEEDDVLLEIATDKVDSEIPSPVEGKISKILYKEGDVVPVGKVIAIISLNGEAAIPSESAKEETKESPPQQVAKTVSAVPAAEVSIKSESGRFYSPLVKTIAKQENISVQELDSIVGTGQNSRVTKNDILGYLQNRKIGEPKASVLQSKPLTEVADKPKIPVSIGAQDEIVEMDRMRRLIADHMVMSKHTAPHVTGFVEADVTNIVLWRNKIKDEFQKREKINLTYMPIFLEAVAKALKDFPQVN